MISNRLTFPLLLLLILPRTVTAGEQLTIGIYDDLILQEQRSRAESTLAHLVELIGEQVGVPIKLVVIPGGTHQAMTEALDGLQRDRLQLVVPTGVEYGWLRQQKNCRLSVLAVTDPGIQAGQYEQLIVRADDKRQPPDLSGGAIATYTDPRPSLTIYLGQLQRKWGPEFLSRRSQPFPSPTKALQAVLAGEADATICDLYTMQGYQRVFPGQVAKLKILGRSAPYPLVPIAGEEQRINALRPDLWKKLQAALAQIHSAPKARAFLDVWRVRRFNLPPADYDDRALKAAEDFPLRELPRDRPR